MHYWGDGFPYFQEVGRAADEIGDFCVKWGRIRVTCTKEKFGTSRVYCSFGHYQIGSLISPGTGWYGDWPWWCKWTWKIYTPKWINALLIPYQRMVYRLAYRIAIRKYSMIKKEILYGADWPEFLKGL